MKRLRLLALGTRLAIAGGRPAWIRLSLIALGFAAGSALLLSAAGVVPGVHAGDVRRDTIEGIGVSRHAKGALHVWSLPQSFGDLDVQVSVVQPIGAAPIPTWPRGCPSTGATVRLRAARNDVAVDRIRDRGPHARTARRDDRSRRCGGSRRSDDLGREAGGSAPPTRRVVPTPVLQRRR
jgi:hypothetical protein